MRDNRTNEQTFKIELLSQWKLEAEFHNFSNQECLNVLLAPIVRGRPKLSPSLDVQRGEVQSVIFSRL